MNTEQQEALRGEEEWKMDRLGNVTASLFSEFVKKSRKGDTYELSQSETAKKLIYKIAWERVVKDHNITDAMERLDVDAMAIRHGNMYEGSAVTRYEETTGRKVDYTNKYIAYSESMGGTPDGYIGKQGIIEIKCPWNGGNHMMTMMTGEVYDKKHLIQIQGYLLITDRKWCDFVTYDPDMPYGLDIAIIRVPRDEAVIEGIRMVMEQVVQKLEEITKEIGIQIEMDKTAKEVSDEDKG